MKPSDKEAANLLATLDLNEALPEEWVQVARDVVENWNSRTKVSKGMVQALLSVIDHNVDALAFLDDLHRLTADLVTVLYELLAAEGDHGYDASRYVAAKKRARELLEQVKRSSTEEL